MFWVEASTQENTVPRLRIKYRSGCVASCHNSQNFQGPWSLQATWLCVKVTFLHISRSLANGGCQQRPHRGRSCTFTSSGPAQESKGRKIRPLRLPTTAEGVEESDSKEGDQTKNSKEEMGVPPKCSKEGKKTVPSQIKVVPLLAAQVDNGDLEVSSQRCLVLHLLSFPARGRLRRMSDCPAAGRKPYRAWCWAEMLLRVTGRQLQSPSWVTVVTGVTNPLTHSRDGYLVPNSISQAWLWADKLPL